MKGVISSLRGIVALECELDKASPALMYAQARGAPFMLSLVFIIASFATVEAATAEAPTAEAPTTTTCESESSWINFTDGMAALIIGLIWALRTYKLRQSYSSYEAPHWASLRRQAFWLSITVMAVAIGAIILGWCQPGPMTMSNVVAVLVGAFITVAIEYRPQGRPSAKLWTLQKLLQRPFYRAGEVRMYGHGDNRTALFEESHSPPRKSAKSINEWTRSTWVNTAVSSLEGTWAYYVKPGPINDHCYLGRYKLLEDAAAGEDPIIFAAAYASVTTAYLSRLKMEGLQKKVLKIIIITISNQENRATEMHAENWGPGRVRNSLGSWRRRSLALHLLGTEEVEMGDISRKPDVDKLSVDALTVLWAVCWLEIPERMECIMDEIAKHLKAVHAEGKEWVRETEEGILEKSVEDALKLSVGHNKP